MQRSRDRKCWLLCFYFESGTVIKSISFRFFSNSLSSRSQVSEFLKRVNPKEYFLGFLSEVRGFALQIEESQDMVAVATGGERV